MCILYLNISEGLLEGCDLKKLIIEYVQLIYNKRNRKWTLRPLVANMGRDTDTMAVVAGRLAGIMYGYDSIQNRWI